MVSFELGNSGRASSSCGARSDESPARLASASAPACLQRRDFILQCFQARRVRGLLRGERAVDLALQFLLDVADLGVERGGVGDRAAILGRLGERVQRVFKARYAGRELGDIRRRLHLALFQCLDPGIQRPERLAVARRRRRRFELGETALEGSRSAPSRRGSCSRQGPSHHADQAAEQPRGEMGDEALELGRARPWRGPAASVSTRRRLVSASTAGSADAVLSGAGSMVGDAVSSCAGSTVTSVAVPSMVGAGRFRTGAHMVAKCVSHDAYRRCSNRGPTRMPPQVR